MFFFGILFWGLWLLLLVFPAWVILATITRPRRLPDQGVCDRCRYPVAGLTSMNCPECGSSLLVSGIATPAMEIRRRGSLPWALTAWSTIALIIGGYAVSITWMTTSFPVTSLNVAVTTASLTVVQSAGAQRRLSVQVTESEGVDGWLSTAVELTPADGASPASFTAIVDGSGAWTFHHWMNPDGRTGRGGPLGSPAASLRDWLVALGEDPASPTLAAEADALVALIGDLAQADDAAAVTATGEFTIVPGSLSTAPGFGGAPAAQRAARASTAPTWIAAAIVLSVWLGGLWLIVWRRRALLRRYGVLPAGAAAAPA